MSNLIQPFRCELLTTQLPKILRGAQNALSKALFTAQKILGKNSNYAFDFVISSFLITSFCKTFPKLVEVQLWITFLTTSNGLNLCLLSIHNQLLVCRSVPNFLPNSREICSLLNRLPILAELYACSLLCFFHFELCTNKSKFCLREFTELNHQNLKLNIKYKRE